MKLMLPKFWDQQIWTGPHLVRHLSSKLSSTSCSHALFILLYNRMFPNYQNQHFDFDFAKQKVAVAPFGGPLG